MLSLGFYSTQAIAQTCQKGEDPGKTSKTSASGMTAWVIADASITGLALGAIGVGVASIFVPGLGAALGGFGGYIFLASGGATLFSAVILGIFIQQCFSKKQGASQSADIDGDQGVGTTVKQESKELTPLTKKCIELYKEKQEAWVMVPPKGEPVIGIGTASYKGAGHFKIHISISPEQMEDAIPLILETLFQEGAPVVGFKFQTEQMLEGEHQIGKEFALIFSAKAEKKEKSSHAIASILETLHKKFTEKGIEAEEGLVLTAETKDAIANAPAGTQSLEKRNIERRKYDRQIPGSPYFYYRNEDYTAISNDQDWATSMTREGREDQKMFLFSEMDQILNDSPKIIHNPLNLSDPYIYLSLKDL